MGKNEQLVEVELTHFRWGVRMYEGDELQAEFERVRVEQCEVKTYSQAEGEIFHAALRAWKVGKNAIHLGTITMDRLEIGSSGLKIVGEPFDERGTRTHPRFPKVESMWLMEPLGDSAV
jgi:hypothetical protein